jgi:hypothetical protein
MRRERGGLRTQTLHPLRRKRAWQAGIAGAAGPSQDAGIACCDAFRFIAICGSLLDLGHGIRCLVDGQSEPYLSGGTGSSIREREMEMNRSDVLGLVLMLALLPGMVGAAETIEYVALVDGGKQAGHQKVVHGDDGVTRVDFLFTTVAAPS